MGAMWIWVAIYGTRSIWGSTCWYGKVCFLLGGTLNVEKHKKIMSNGKNMFLTRDLHERYGGKKGWDFAWTL